MTGQQLRNSILQEAIQGRLVPNVLEPGEKTGAELLQQILKERQDRENKEKGKKAKKLTLSSLDEDPWELPDGWCWCSLGDIFDIYTGDSISESLKESKYKRVKIGYNYIGTKDVEFDHSVVYENGVKIPFNESKFKIAKSTAVLMCIEGGSAGKKIARITQDVCFGNKLCNFYCTEKTTNDYLYYYLQSANFRELFFDKINGLIGGVSIKKLLLLEIPLPPLSIQKAIVAKIEKLFPLVDEYDKAAGELETLNKILPDKLRKTVLQEAIHGSLVPNNIPEGEATGAELLQQILKERQDRENKEKGKKAKKLTLSTIEEEPWGLPDGWCWCKLGDLFYKVTDGTHSTPKYMPSGVPFISVKDISKGRIDFSNTKYISKEEHAELIKRCEPKRGDLLLTKVGTTGIPVIVDTDKEFSLFVSVALCKHIDGYYNLRYILNAINSPLIQSKIAKDTLGAANKNWVIDKIMNTDLPLPPLSIQHRIVEKIEEVFAAIDNLPA